MREIHIGQIIRQRRLQLGLTQEELCEGICEPPSLSRIESGKQTPSHSKLCVLMQRLGLPGNKYYALMSDNELAIEQLQNEIISCNMRRDSQEGLRKLAELSALCDPKDNLAQQFILRSQVLLGKKEQWQIIPYGFEEKLALLDQAIRLTLPSFNIHEIGKHWYCLNEMKLINQLGLTYGEAQQNAQAIDIYYQFLRHIRGEEFQVNNDTVPVVILVAYNYAKLLCDCKRYEEAIEIANWGWNVSVQWGRSTYLGGLLYVLGESSYCLGNRDEGRWYYLRSYYSFSAAKDEENADRIEDLIYEYFSDVLL